LAKYEAEDAFGSIEIKYGKWSLPWRSLITFTRI